MIRRPPYVSKFSDRHGKVRYRFRRKGYPARYFKAAFGTKEFEREYASCLNLPEQSSSSERRIHGSVSDAIARYYADNAFQDLQQATKTVYEGVLNRFCKTFGDDKIRAFDAERIQRLMNGMRGKPHAAARLRKLLSQLFVVARREKLVPDTFDPVKDTRPPKPPNKGGYHRWSEEELAQFESTHSLGCKPRLAFAILLYGAQRSGDARLMDRRMITSGRIAIEQSKTLNNVDLPIVTPLQEALEAGPLGERTLLESNRRKPYTEKGFYNLIKRACIAAGLPHCSAHGLRKSAARRLRDAGCTDEEGMAITGHKTVREYRRYAGESGNGARADSAMEKTYGTKMSNLKS